MGVKNKHLGSAAVASCIAAAATFILLTMFTNLDFSTILFISLGLASSAGAIVAVDRGDSIGTVVGFSTLLLLLFFVAPYLPKTAIIFVTSTATIILEPMMIPLLLLGLVAIVAVIHYIGGNVYRFALWILTIALTFAWFVYIDPIARILMSAIIAVIVFTPLESLGSKAAKFFAVTPVALMFDKAVVIDLTNVNVYIAYLLPFLTFIALDPTDRILPSYRGLASIVTLFVVFIQIISFMFQII